MRRLIAILTLAALGGLLLFSQDQILIVRKRAAAPTCAVGYDYIGTVTTTRAIGETDNVYYVGQGQAFTMVATHNVCKLSFIMTKRAGTLAGKTFYATIWASTGTYDNLPANPITNGVSDPFTCSGTACDSWSGTQVDFSFSTPPTMTATVAYNITVHMDGNSDGTNNSSIGSADAGVYSGSESWWTKAKAFNNGDSTDLWIKIWW